MSLRGMRRRGNLLPTNDGATPKTIKTIITQEKTMRAMLLAFVVFLLPLLCLPGLRAEAAETRGSQKWRNGEQPPGHTFQEALRAEGGMDAPHGAAPLILPGGESPGSRGARAGKEELAVEKAGGENACRVAEIFARAGELNGKTVQVRGKVVKNSRMIMGKNWLHLQDGSGDEAKGEHDLVVTTEDSAEPGEIVTVSGTVAADRDFGMGYSYRVLLENARVER